MDTRSILAASGGRIGLPLVALVALAAAPARTLPGAQARAEPDRGPARSYSIPETRQARALFDRAREHLEAERWPEAIADLQELIADHRGDVLGPASVEDGRPVGQLVHPGVAEAARRELLALPPEARQLYRERHASEAGAALQAARRSADRRALVEVARRWPISDAARGAWWTLGDLELELGNPTAAEDAWERARALEELDGRPLDAGAAARAAYFAERRDDGAIPPPPRASAQRLPGPGEATATAPGTDAHSWFRVIDDEHGPVPFGSDSQASYNLFPALSGDTLLVSNSLRLLAFDAWTGRERWRTPEPPGWDLVDTHQMYAQHDGEKLDRMELFDAIDRNSVMIAPAAAGGIVVVPLQIPMTQLGNTRYQNIPITRAIPDRRLFAFDVETGRELWNHMPPPLWDGESGSFEERMRVAAPPVIAGTRVLVPAYRMQGRIDYHLACFDLFTGRLMWSTALISGQLPLNMFGRHQWEFAAAPVRVEGDRVLTVTQLGAVAACDLYTGDVLWETLYDQIPLPPTMHWATRERRLDWRNAPPVVADGVLVATPLDSRDLIGLDVESGAPLWSLDYERIQRRGEYTRLALLGAERDTVYLAGGTVITCHAPAGLAAPGGPIDVTHGPDLPLDHSEWFPRPALGERHVIAPTPTRRVAIDRFNIRYEDRQASADWEAGQSAGNALLGDGALFLLSNRQLTAIFDWNVLERRAADRFAAEPDSDPAAIAYAELLAGRARSEIGAARLPAALEHLARARGILDERLAVADRGYHGELEELLHRVLRDEAEGMQRSVRPWPQVLERLRQAEATAPGDEALRDTLVAMAELLEGAGARAEWLATLERLERSCAELPMPAPELDPERRQPLAAPVPVGLWVATRRAREHARSGAVAEELEELHAILADHGDAVLSGYEALGEARQASGAPPRVSQRIAALIATHGAEVYAPFERRAEAALEDALGGPGPVDPAALERVIDRYPHSSAAERATDARIARALEEGDAGTVVALVQRSLPERFSPRTAGPREVELLLSMGRALARAGNAQLEERLVAELARAHPELVPPEAVRAPPDPGAAAARAPHPGFDRSVSVRAEIVGSHDLIAVTPPSGERPQLLLAVQDGRHPHFDELVAFSAADPERPLWFRRIEDGVHGDRRRAAYVARDTLVVAGTSAVLIVDLQDGVVRWKWNAGLPRGVDGVVGDAGVAVAVLHDAPDSTRLRAFDAAGGLPLWSRPLSTDEYWPVPVVGSGRVCLLPRSYTPARALVLDLFTGAEVTGFELDPVDGADSAGAWIEDGALLLPRFPKTSPSERVMSAWDLDDGRRRWAVDNPDGLEFDSVARAPGGVYLVFSAGRQKPGAVQQLDTRLGAVRTLAVNVRPGDVPIGMDRHRVTPLPGPWMYFQSRSETSGSETIVRAIHLPFGEKWRHRLPVAPSEIYDGLPLPVSAGDTTVLAWTEPTRDASVRPMTQLLFLDRESGTLQDSRSLDPDLGPAGTVTFALLGTSLAILGSHEMVFLSR